MGIVLAILVVAVLSLPVALLRGFGLMLAVGIVHADLFHNVPTLSYWVSVGLAWALSVAFGNYNANNSNKP